MEQIPSEDEIIRMAVETRKQVTSAVVTEEEKKKWQATVEKLIIPTRAGDSEVYFSFQEKDVITPLVINFHGGGFIKKGQKMMNMSVLMWCAGHFPMWKSYMLIWKRYF